MQEYPSWYCFRHYFYEKNYHKKAKATISRNGLSNYQRNERPLFGSASDWKDKIGAYQMDATQADIYLVSRLDRKEVIGRPNVYMAVDTLTQLITGIYVGLEAGEQAIINCLANTAMDKVEFCKSYGIEISKDEWPNTGLPGEIITDKGKEFVGSRMNELAMKYGIEFEALPPFRPDEKGLVEKTFDLIQQKYKPLLRGKGVIEADAQERWAVDYRTQATLTLDEFTKVVIHYIVYFNSCRVLENYILQEVEPVSAKIWNWYEEQGLSNVIPINEKQLYQFGLLRKGAVLNRKGINNQGLWYVSQNYKKLLEYKKIGESVQIAYDLNDVTKIYLIDGIDFIPFELASYCQKYAGATQTECKLETKKIQERKRALKLLDTEGRIEALQNVQQIINKAEKAEKNKVDTETIQANRRKELL